MFFNGKFDIIDVQSFALIKVKIVFLQMANYMLIAYFCNIYLITAPSWLRY